VQKCATKRTKFPGGGGVSLVKDEMGRNEWVARSFEKTYGIRSPYLDRGVVCSAIFKILYFWVFFEVRRSAGSGVAISPFFHEDDQLIDHLAWMVANARYASLFHGESVLGDVLPNFKCAKSAISAISPLGWR
jgi:hypothetical protein